MKRSRFVALTSAIAVTPAEAFAQSVQPIRIGFGYADSMAQAVYADKLGFFKQAGLSVETIGIASGGQLTTSVVAGATDIAVSNVINLAIGITHRAPLKLIAGGALYTSASPTQAICVARDSTIRTARDLEGKTLAVTALKDLTEVGCRAWIDQNGGDSSKVRITELTMASMAAAVGRGTVDAAFMGEPFLSIAKKNGARVLGFAYDAIAPQFLLSSWFTSDAYLKANLGIVKRFVDVVYKTARWANAHRDESAPMLAEAAKLDPAVVAGSTRMEYSIVLDPRLIEPPLSAMARYDGVDKLLPASDLIAKL